MVVDRVVVMVVVCHHLMRDMCRYGSAGRSDLTLGSCCGGRAGAGVGGVFEGFLRRAGSYTRLLLVDQLPGQRAPVRTVTHVHRAVTRRLNSEKRQMCAP